MRLQFTRSRHETGTFLVCFSFYILHDSGYAMKPTIIYDKSTSGNSTLLFEIVPS
jgi:hypothetical protein